MAGAAATYAVEALPSPGGVHGDLSQWELSVPISPISPHDEVSPATKSRISNDSSSTHAKDAYRRYPRSHSPNGLDQPRTSSHSVDDPNGYRGDHSNHWDANNSEMDHVEGGSQRRHRRNSSQGNANVAQSGERKERSRQQTNQHGAEDAYWIHRDKLAKIENEELQKAGIQLPHHRFRSGSKSSSRRGRSHDSHSNGIGSVMGENGESVRGSRDEKRQRIASPTRIEPVQQEPEEDPDMGGPMAFDPRLPNEIAADPYEDGAPGVYKNPGLRKSSSRIPVLATSPHPIPQEHLEREFPLPRTRANTIASMDGESLAQVKAAAAALESNGAPNDTSSSTVSSRPVSRGNPLQNSLQNSPQKGKGAGKPGTARKSSAPPTGGRKTSVAQKPRAASSASRPVTRSGEGRQPTTINRPEGDPPWLATMYKPDPRLPPDQQILPTHARKMQQEQWEKEGKLPSTYDKEFGPLVVPDQSAEPKEAPPPPEPKDSNNAWPLQAEPKSPELRPSTSGTDHGGYKTMPSLLSPGLPPSAPVSPQIGPQIGPQQPIVFADPPEEKKKEKGCGCCIVM